MGHGEATACPAQTTPVPAKALKGGGGGSSEFGRLGKMQTVAMRSSAGQEFASLSPTRCNSPSGGWTVISHPSPPPASLSPIGSGCGSSRGGKRRFFGLSETAEAEAQGVTNAARRGDAMSGASTAAYSASAAAAGGAGSPNGIAAASPNGVAAAASPDGVAAAASPDGVAAAASPGRVAGALAGAPGGAAGVAEASDGRSGLAEGKGTGGAGGDCGGSGGGREGKEFIDAHRMVVSLRSDPMRAMLRSGMRETFATDALVKDIRAPVFSALLTYIYTDTLQLDKPADIMELLVVANQYTLTDLVSLCEGFLQGVMDEENACNLYHYADALGMPTFEHRVLTFILRNWSKVVR
ncbi:unnamed protein product, partial [Laminaria digitata]